jgi:hypothetical protein
MLGLITNVFFVSVFKILQPLWRRWLQAEYNRTILSCISGHDILSFHPCIPPKPLRISNDKLTPLPESANELYRPSDRRLSAKLVPIFADRGCHVVGVTDPYGPYSRFSRPAVCISLYQNSACTLVSHIHIIPPAHLDLSRPFSSFWQNWGKNRKLIS